MEVDGEPEERLVVTVQIGLRRQQCLVQKGAAVTYTLRHTAMEVS